MAATCRLNTAKAWQSETSSLLSDTTMRSLQKFAVVHSSVHNHFNLERHINDRNWFKENRQIALAEWRQLAA